MENWRELKMMVKALADIGRLTIVYHLARQEEITVSTLTEMLGLSQPLASWHIRKLRRAGLIARAAPDVRFIVPWTYCDTTPVSRAYRHSLIPQLS